jgi:hypothetical protein
MKTALKAFTLFVLLTAAAIAQPDGPSNSSIGQPSRELFEKIFSASEKAGFSGYDGLACFNKKGKLVLGGLYFWHTPLQIVMADKAGNLIPTVNETKDPASSTFAFTLNGHQMTFSYGKNKGLVTDSQNDHYTSYEATLKSGQKKIPLDCFLLISGLE